MTSIEVCPVPPPLPTKTCDWLFDGFGFTPTRDDDLRAEAKIYFSPEEEQRPPEIHSVSELACRIPSGMWMLAADPVIAECMMHLFISMASHIDAHRESRSYAMMTVPAIAYYVVKGPCHELSCSDSIRAMLELMVLAEKEKLAGAVLEDYRAMMRNLSASAIPPSNIGDYIRGKLAGKGKDASVFRAGPRGAAVLPEVVPWIYEYVTTVMRPLVNKKLEGAEALLRRWRDGKKKSVDISH